MHRIDPNYGMNMGLINEIRMESGSLVNPRGIIATDLQEDSTIIVQLQGKLIWIWTLDEWQLQQMTAEKNKKKWDSLNRT